MENTDDNDTAQRSDVGSTKRARVTGGDGDDEIDAEGNARALARAHRGVPAPLALINLLQDKLPPEMLAEVIGRLDVPGNLLRMEQVSRYLQEETQSHWTEVLLQVLAMFNYFQGEYWALNLSKNARSDDNVRLMREAMLAHRDNYKDIPGARKLVVDVVRQVADKMAAVVLTLIAREGKGYDSFDLLFDINPVTIYMRGASTDAAPSVELMTLYRSATDRYLPIFRVPGESPLRERRDLMTAIKTFNAVTFPLLVSTEPAPYTGVPVYLENGIDAVMFEVAHVDALKQLFFRLLMDWSPFVMMRAKIKQTRYGDGKQHFTQMRIGIAPDFIITQRVSYKDGR